MITSLKELLSKISRNHNYNSGILTFRAPPEILITNRYGRKVDNYNELSEVVLDKVEKDFITNNWVETLKKHKDFYDGYITAVIDVLYEPVDNVVTFVMDRARYSLVAAILKSDYPNKDRVKDFISFGVGLMSNLNVAPDDSFLMLERSQKVHTEKGAISVPGGTVEYREYDKKDGLFAFRVSNLFLSISQKDGEGALFGDEPNLKLIWDKCQEGNNLDDLEAIEAFNNLLRFIKKKDRLQDIATITADTDPKIRNGALNAVIKEFETNYIYPLVFTKRVKDDIKDGFENGALGELEEEVLPKEFLLEYFSSFAFRVGNLFLSISQKEWESALFDDEPNLKLIWDKCQEGNNLDDLEAIEAFNNLLRFIKKKDRLHDIATITTDTDPKMRNRALNAVMGEFKNNNIYPLVFKKSQYLKFGLADLNQYFSAEIISISWQIKPNGLVSLNTYFDITPKKPIDRVVLYDAFNLAKDKSESTGKFCFVNPGIDVANSGNRGLNATPLDIIEGGKLEHSGAAALASAVVRNITGSYERGVYPGLPPRFDGFERYFKVSGFSIFDLSAVCRIRVQDFVPNTEIVPIAADLSQNRQYQVNKC